MSSDPSPAMRYHPISARYRELFGCKVYKVSVSVAETCPNRTGRQGRGVCTFCDEWGSAAHPERAPLPLTEQFRATAQAIRERYHAEKFLVYFQAYTNTFARLRRLAELFREALANPDVVGLVIGTRPDCLPPRTMALLAELAQRTYVSVELGVQTLDDAQLQFLSRGHDAACSLRALAALGRVRGIDVCAHLMFGIPGETERQLQETAMRLGELGTGSVKLHNLHVLRGTPLAELYVQGRFEPVSLDAYADKVIHFLEHLPSQVAVHRLNAVASRWDDVVAPDWARKKLEPTQFILERMAERNTWQGRCAVAGPVPVAALRGEVSAAHARA